MKNFHIFLSKYSTIFLFAVISFIFCLPTDVYAKEIEIGELGDILDAFTFDDASQQALIVLGSVLMYYLAAIKTVGKAKPQGMVSMTDQPPQGLNPAELGYFCEYFTHQAKFLALLIIDFAARGMVTISRDEKNQFKISRIQQEVAGIPDHEKKIFYGLFGNDPSFVISKLHKKVIVKQNKRLEKSLEKSFPEADYLIYNFKWLLGGFLFSLGAIAYTVFMGRPDHLEGIGFLTVWLSIWSIGVLALGAGVWGTWKSFFAGEKSSFKMALGITAFATPFFIGEVVALVLYIAMLGVYIFGSILCLLYLLYWAFKKLRRYTEAGQVIHEQVESYRLFLAPEEELSFKSPTAQDYEKHLANALAMNCSAGWHERCAWSLDHGSQSVYLPDWYKSLHVPDEWTESDFGTGICEELTNSLHAVINDTVFEHKPSTSN